jgi:predicted negative regulator of RcsB-dependent stress response
MAKHLDLEEQEQLDQLKHFWKQYGNWISWALILVFGSVAGWNAFQYWQRSQAAQAAGLFEEVDRAAQAGDLAKLERSLTDMKDHFGRTTFAQQAALLAAKVYYEKGKADAARAALSWVADTSSDEGYQALAHLRLAGLALDAKAYDEATKQLEGPFPKEFDALVADRRGDVFLAKGNRSQARVEYEKAYRLFEERTEYRRLVEVKLNAMGVDPTAAMPTTVSAPAAADPALETKK